MPLASVASGHTRCVIAVEVPRVVSAFAVAVTGSGWTGSVKSRPVATSRTRPLAIAAVTEALPFQPLRISFERSALGLPRSVGWAWASRAAAPVTNGAANDVPDQPQYVVVENGVARARQMSVPGAARSTHEP